MILSICLKYTITVSVGAKGFFKYTGPVCLFNTGPQDLPALFSYFILLASLSIFLHFHSLTGVSVKTTVLPCFLPVLVFHGGAFGNGLISSGVTKHPFMFF